MIEIKFWFDDIEGIRDFGILLLQNNIIYKLRKKGDYFAVFIIETRYNEWIYAIKTNEDISNNQYAEFTLSIGKDTPPLKFKAFALKIY